VLAACVWGCRRLRTGMPDLRGRPGGLVVRDVARYDSGDEIAGAVWIDDRG